MTITAAADGSALGNPGPAGWAWYIDENTWHAGGWAHGTNNMGELKAVLDLLESTASRADEHLLILCDSQYVINSVTKWMPGWKRKGWKKKDGKPVLNVDLLKSIDTALEGRSVEFEWVKGHAGHDLNEAADQRARAVATAFSKGVSAPTGPGFTRDAALEERPVETSPVPSGVTANTDANGDADMDELQLDLFSAFADFESSALDTDEQDVLRLERSLLTETVHTDRTRMEELLHPEFESIGSLGQRTDRVAILAGADGKMPNHIEGWDPELSATDFRAVLVAPRAILVTYQTESEHGIVMRSSLWIRELSHDGEGPWLLRFRQGTIVS
ncbi:RNase H family protein [Devriesea agamarum]|uniref:RNase H family protein n=1 Tax=Devriesea agamarum TaxID=472569 RepID=UPI00071D3E9F|nr:RNase H family protein [Devriesea agamarum]